MLVAFFVVVTLVCHIALPLHCRLQWSSERFCVTFWVSTMRCSVLYYWSSVGSFRVHLNHERPHPLFSVVLVISFLVLFVLLVLRVWVNSSYCQSRETLFRTLNKGCYKKSWGVDDQSSFLPTTFSLQLPCLSFSWLPMMKLIKTENSHILN